MHLFVHGTKLLGTEISTADIKRRMPMEQPPQPPCAPAFAVFVRPVRDPYVVWLEQRLQLDKHIVASQARWVRAGCASVPRRL